MILPPAEESAAVVANMDLVHAIARKYFWMGVERDDLLQEGAIGLLKGIRAWSPDGGASLRTYCAQWIRADVRRAIGVDRSGRLAIQTECYSMDSPLSEDAGDDRTLHDALASCSETPEEAAWRSERLHAVADALSSRSDRDASVVVRCIALEHSGEQVGKDIGVNRQRVQQILAESLAVLKRRLAGAA